MHQKLFLSFWAYEMPLATTHQSGFLALSHWSHDIVQSVAPSCDTSKTSSCLGEAKVHEFLHL